MARVHAFVNSSKINILSSEVRREGDRGIDEAKLELPANVAIAVSDDVQIVQDAVDLNCLVGAYMMQGIVKDESGKNNHAFGEVAIPRADVIINWCSVAAAPANTGGFRDFCITNTGVTSTCGKVTCNAMCFNSACQDWLDVDCSACVLCNSITASFSLSLWVNFTTVQARALVAKSNGLNMNVSGWTLKTRSGDDKIRFKFSDGASNGIDLSWLPTCGLADGNWHNIVITYNGNTLVSGMSGYIDGVKIANSGHEDTVACTTCGSYTNCFNITVGSAAAGTAGTFFDGAIEDVRFFKQKELSAEQARAIFNRGVLTETCGKFGNAFCFNGIDSNVYIPDVVCHDFCGLFDIQVWAKWTAACNGIILDKRTAVCDGFYLITEFSCSSIVFGANCSTISYGTAGVTLNDGVWHLIRVYRNSADLVTLEVDNVARGCATITGDWANTSDLYIGTSFLNTLFFNGAINVIRIYKGKNLSTTQASRIFTDVKATSLMKLGGIVTKVINKISKKDVTIQSYGEELGVVEVRAQNYHDRSPEYIIEDLIRNNTSLIPHIHGCPTGIIVEQFNADGKLIDLLKDLTQMSCKTFDTDANRLFHLHDPMFNCTCFTFTHGICAQNFDDADDDTEIINDMLILGEKKRYDKTEIFNACSPACCIPDGSNLTFCLINSPIGGTVLVAGVAKEPEVCFEFCSLNNRVNFLIAPPACQTVTVNYTYDLTLIVTGENTCSIATHGKHSKRLIMPWIRSRNDGVKFVSSYLARYKDIRTSYKVTLGVMKNSVREGDVVTLVNSVKGINAQFVVKSITWRYPDMKTDLLLGEFLFDDLEYQAQIVGKIHDLEAVLGEVKTIVCGTTVAETLVFCAGFNIYCATSCGTTYSETIAMTDVILITVIAQGFYGDCATEYGGDFAYTSG